MALTLIGTVTSAKADKTITVTVTTRETHPLYKKQYTVSRKYVAHDQNNQAQEGDQVLIAESRPFSKTKTWVLEKVLKQARGRVELRDEISENFPKEVADAPEAGKKETN